MIIRVRPENDSVITKTVTFLTDDFKLIVEHGCKAELVVNGERHLFSEGEYNISAIFGNVRKNLFGKVVPHQKLIAYGSKSEFSDAWGIPGIPYRDSEGRDIQVGCNGNIRFDVISPARVYDWIAQEVNSNDIDSISSDSVWGTIHQEMDQIIRNYIAQYYNDSNRRDGTDFEPYKTRIVSELSQRFQTSGLSIVSIFVNNLSNPVLPQAAANQTVATQAAPIIEEHQKNSDEEKICPRCTLINKPGVRHCVRCGEKLN